MECGDMRGPEQAGEFRHDIAEVHNQNDGHQKKRYAKPKLLAYQVGQPFAAIRAQTRAHLQGDVEDQRHWNQSPQDGIAELRSRLRIGVDAARVIVHVRDNQAGTHNRKEHGDAFPERPDHTSDPVQPLIPIRPSGGDVRSVPHLFGYLVPYFSRCETTSSTVMAPIGRFSLSITVNIRRLIKKNGRRAPSPWMTWFHIC